MRRNGASMRVGLAPYAEAGFGRYAGVRRGARMLRGFGETADEAATQNCPASNGMQSQTDPLPPGRYWMDLTGAQNIADFMSTLQAAAAAGVVTIENQEDTSVSFIDKLFGGSGDEQAWVLWTVTGVGTFSMDATRYGYPTMAPDCITTADQTVTSPDPASVTKAQLTIPTWAWWAGGFVIFLLASNAIKRVADAKQEFEETKR